MTVFQPNLENCKSFYHYAGTGTYFFFFNVYLFLRERQSVSRGGEEREGGTELEAGSGLRAVSTEPDVGLQLMNREIIT